MNRTQWATVAVVAACVGVLGSSVVARGATATGVVSAEIVSGIAITPASELDFGQCVARGAVGQVVMTPSGTRSSGGSVILGNPRSGSPGSFHVAGAMNTTYSIALPAYVRIRGGTASMIVDHFVSAPTMTGALGRLGYQVLMVGATLNIGARQAHGTYVGTYDVTVAYN